MRARAESMGAGIWSLPPSRKLSITTHDTRGALYGRPHAAVHGDMRWGGRMGRVFSPSRLHIRVCAVVLRDTAGLAIRRKVTVWLFVGIVILVVLVASLVPSYTLRNPVTPSQEVTENQRVESG
jgi:hypothetical protein